MKQALGFLFLLSLSQFLLAQPIDLPMENAVWYSDGYGDMGEPAQDLRIAPDSLVVIDGKTYAWTTYRAFPYYNGEEIHYRSENGRVYVLPKDSLEEKLLYDFNLVAGDTFYVTWGLRQYDSVAVTVQNINLITTEDGKVRKYFTLEGNFHYCQWVEGIGDVNWVFLFPGYLWSVSGGFNFRCFSENNERVYATGGFSGCIITGIDEVEKPTLSQIGYPNPFSDQFYLKNENGRFKAISLFDSSGKMVLHETALVPGQAIKLENQAAGLYLLKVVLNDGSVLSQKLLKQL